ncbi:hypothetical protein [Tautonia plasticadhaerens]|uniref:PEP-CTERM protein-sorting domain-containing protein n=1 Tax=Tautonia plasticadhaerens TaxID=2527974 RepID=A0A518H066_9BACT|nr:hypothetical protein [Tautonia plasticadhaerens]QDV34236.1 hypothetical protein ElP_21210 [Tautonia plasticadhaerens]
MRQRNCPILFTVGFGLFLASAGTASAGAIGTMTGDVEVDFPIAPKNGVVAIVDNPGADGGASPWDVAQHQKLPGTTGWNIKDLRLAYDDSADRMYLGLNFFGIAGDADGDGDPGSLSVGMGKDMPSLGGMESIVVALDLNLDGVPDVVSGVPTQKSGGAPGTSAFTVAKYQHAEAGLGFSFGDTLADHVGSLAFDPSAEHPDFQFTIDNFMKLEGLVPEDGFIISAFAGAPDDVIAGEDFIASTRIAFPGKGNQNVPEPATLLGWALIAGGAIAYRGRNRVSRGR